MNAIFPARRTRNRQGSMAILAALFLVIMLACVAFAVDLGYLCLARSQAQNAADAAAMAAAWKMLDEKRAHGTAAFAELVTEAQDTAGKFAAANTVAGKAPQLGLNARNELGGDLVFGRMTSDGQVATSADPLSWNSVFVRVRRDAKLNGPVSLFFARALGIRSAAVEAEAIATFQDGIEGFRTPTGPTSLVPFAMSIQEWKNILAGTGGTDNWSWNSQTRTVGAGPDGLCEIKLFPDSTQGGGIVPGNFGTLNIGPPNLGSPDLVRQIGQGISAADLDYYGGALALDPTSGTLKLGGDTGLTSTIFSTAQTILGKPITVFLYDGATHAGATSVFTIVGFAGVRIVSVEGRGAPGALYVQPAVVVDNAAMPGTAPSPLVYRKVILTR